MPKIKTKTITLEVIKRQFNVSSQQAADNLGIHVTTMRILCKKYGIRRWPYLQMMRIDKQVHRFRQSSSFDDRSLALVEDYKQRLPFSSQVVDQDECPSVDIEFLTSYGIGAVKFVHNHFPIFKIKFDRNCADPRREAQKCRNS
jgi:hypothetical protein